MVDIARETLEVIQQLEHQWVEGRDPNKLLRNIFEIVLDARMKLATQPPKIHDHSFVTCTNIPPGAATNCPGAHLCHYKCEKPIEEHQ